MSDTGNLNSFGLDHLIGTVINNNYQVEEKIGEGGMGAVFRARQLQNRQPVAIKVISPRLVAQQKDTRRFLREARIGLMLSHPGIVKVYEFGETGDGLLFMAMEYIEGIPLVDYIEENAPLTPNQCLRLLKPLCAALDYAHGKNILHRDLKPANIIITTDSYGQQSTKLVDFGIMKLLQPDDHISYAPLTDTNVVLGTPDYMSPEQLMSHTLEPTADVYSLGVILYQMLTGKLPFEYWDFPDLLMQKVYKGIEPPSEIFSFFPASLDEIIMTVMARDPEERYRTPNEFFLAFDRAVITLPQSQRDPDLSAFKPRRREPGDEPPTIATDLD